MWKDYLRTAQRERWKVYNLLCFVDFATPSEARAALETLQGLLSEVYRTRMLVPPATRMMNLFGTFSSHVYFPAMSGHRFSVLYVNAKEMARAGLTHKQEPEEGGQLIGAIRRRERERHALGDDVGSGSGAEKSWAWGQGGGSCVRRQRRPSSAVAGVA
uniref:Uncharacterized protein n=1 Tax=Oryza barthii TaxID=65489 RepID=A0A0D3H964_9ORYZ